MRYSRHAYLIPVVDGKNRWAYDDIMEKSDKKGQISIRVSAENDRPSVDDYCGFAPYVAAVAKFLANPMTSPPLALSIEGSWGSGKSSFMKLLEKELERNAPCVAFEAWRSRKEDSLIASFSRTFVEALRRRAPLPRRIRGDLYLFARRFNWREGWAPLAKALGAAALLGGIATLAALRIHADPEVLGAFVDVFGVSELKDGAQKTILTLLLNSSAIAAVIAAAIGAVQALKPVASAIAIKIDRFRKHPDLARQLDLIEQFQRDFKYIIDSYAPKQKIYCFVDDLDRCEAPRLADLVGELNALIAENPQVIFIVGMDREKVAMSLAAHFRDVAPYARTNEGNGGSGDEVVLAREYGLAFLEKFIQIPFKLPDLEGPFVKSYIERLMRHEGEEDSRPEEKSTGEESLIEVVEGLESEKMIDLYASCAAFLGNNPRSIKRFINLFRLHCLIGYETGMFSAQAGEPLTLEQLAKLIVILLRWPDILNGREESARLLTALQRRAVGGKEIDADLAARADRLLSDRDLSGLLRMNTEDAEDAATAATNSLENVDPGKLMRLSRQVFTLPPRSAQAIGPRSSLK